MLWLTDPELELIAKHLAKTPATKPIHAHLNAYLYGYEYDVQAVYDGVRILAIYRRGVVVATRQLEIHEENVRDVLAGMGFARARKRRKQ